MKTIAGQMERMGEKDPELASWLLAFEEGMGEWVIDLCDLAEKYYFHPDMKGKVSIKAVLPAIWNHNPDLWKDPDFAEYTGRSEGGVQMSPYDALPDMTLSDGTVFEAVREGTGAIRAYEDFLFGAGGKDPEVKDQILSSLLQYCKLDTAAMVIIWKHCAVTFPQKTGQV